MFVTNCYTREKIAITRQREVMSQLVKRATLSLETIKAQGTLKQELQILSPQSASVFTLENQEGKQKGQARKMLNLCANNYLGLANDARLINAAKEALERYGFGMASVRFICGTLDLHGALEKALSEFLGTEDSLLFSSCFDANGGVFEALLTEKDGILSDSLNHASIIDGIRLCKAKRYRYQNNDMDSLEALLKQASQETEHCLIVTDGVFSMDGIIANLVDICHLAARYNASVMVDDSHGVGFMGEDGAGTASHLGVSDKIDLFTGTFGKALGGGCGGYIAGKKAVIALLRQKARPYLFSNSLAPCIVAASLKALQIAKDGKALRKQLQENTAYFRTNITKCGFDIIPGNHPIIPIMVYDAHAASTFAQALQQEGIFVSAFSYPVVPHHKARLRTQISAAHTIEDLSRAVDILERIGKTLNIL